MLAEPEEVWQSSAARALRIRDAIGQMRADLHGDRRLIRTNSHRTIASLNGASAFCKRPRLTLDRIQTRLIDKICECVRLVPIAAVGEALD
ncbi:MULTISPECIES: hypothetical protein [Bradyrhizobium]|uniref:hypothetical protein n=1 Tax=Bradyrhizobium TaxID=374 RepID=UPI0007C5D71A|nr:MULTISPECIES: hypothetical protein [Bradyrhizobium]PAY03323.1 hypothetical protein CK489_39305 [Bradyrhizobium sp. UFLA03-84]